MIITKGHMATNLEKLDYWRRAYHSLANNIKDMPTLIKDLIDENRELKKRIKKNDN